MNYPMVLLVSVALGVDAFSVAVSIGLSGVRAREMLLVSGTVTLFHIFMPLIGLSLGLYLGKIAGPMAGIIGGLILIAIGLSAIWKNLRELLAACTGKVSGGPDGMILDIRNPVSLLLIAAGVSLDALTVGFGLGALQVDLLLTVFTMGLVAGVMTGLGLLFGKKLSYAFGERAEIVGGLILVIIGIQFLR